MFGRSEYQTSKEVNHQRCIDPISSQAATGSDL